MVLRALPGAVVAVLVFFGLLMMHGLETHGTAVSHQGQAWAAQVAAEMTGHGAASHAGPALEQGPGVEDATGTPQADSAGDLGVAMACAFILLLGVSLLVPRIRSVRGPRMTRTGVWPSWFVLRLAPRPPSLPGLCVSRT